MTWGQKSGMSRQDVIKRIIIYALLLIVVATLQCSFFSNLHVCPATPDLLLGLVAAITLLDSKKSAAIVSVAAGFLADALGGSGYSLSPLYYLAAAVVTGLLSEKVLPVFFSYAMILIPALIVRAGYTLLSILISYGSLPMLFTLKGIILPETICTLLLCLPLWPLTRLCTAPLGSRNKFTF